MGRDEENKDPIKKYSADHLYTWVNKNQTEFRIYHRLSQELLWSGTSIRAAEAWLTVHLIPSAMAKRKLSKLVADVFSSNNP
jgi:hypothetical protein